MKVAACLTALVGVAQAFVEITWYDVKKNPNPAPRLDIDNLQKNTWQWTLYIRALQKMYTTSSNDLWGHYQIAGIHGAPHITYDEVNSNNQPIANGNAGYCWHGDQNFYLWHRPYLTLYELAIIRAATSIANSWNLATRSQYQTAVKTLRLPYWDWAKGNQPGTVPSSVSSSKITVRRASDNQPESINNPLFSHQLVTGADSNVGYYGGDKRYPIYVGRGKKRGVTYRGSTYQRDMINIGRDLKKNVAILFNTQKVCWNTFATHDSGEHNIGACADTVKNIQSLEMIHNNVHNGISGTMANLEVSSFDPIFWLHHCNVDRVGALWQAVHPNVGIAATQSDSTTRTNGGGKYGDNLPLYPFRWKNTAKDWWQPKWLYDVRACGYTYPELVGNPSSTNLLAKLNSMYDTGRSQEALSSSTGAKRFKERRSDYLARIFARQEAGTASSNLTAPPPPSELAPFAPDLIAKNGSFQQYIVAVKASKQIAKQSFNLHLFFGNPSDESRSHSSYLDDTNRIGGMGVLGSSNPAGMAMDKTVEGFVDITDPLLNELKIGKLKDLEPATVRKYCRARLVWRVVTADGQDLGKEARSKGLRVKVLHQVVTPQDGDGVAPVVAPANEIQDTSNQTTASPVPSAVLPTSTVSVPSETAEPSSTATA